MSLIRILPEVLSNKIAAGEVVERPASVVKELVENALDAGSTQIKVDVAQGGRSLIRVSDNGTGMSRDDALLAIERYATSKIYTDADLFDIRTLGFRGEALPSIASVSRFTLETRCRDAAVGTRVVVSGGTLRQVEEAGIPVGTMVSVERLFFNTPARRKFLKTVNTEMSHITEIVTTLALGWPGVGFRLSHNERVTKKWAASGDPAERVGDVLGREVRPFLVPVTFDAEAATCTGWVAAARMHRATGRGIHLFINGRSVRDRGLYHALLTAYSGRLMKGQFPIAVLFLQIPSHDVDVNVHPTKSEVRLARGPHIHDLVIQQTRAALNRADQPKWARPQPPVDGQAPADPAPADGKPTPYTIPPFGESPTIQERHSAPHAPGPLHGSDPSTRQQSTSGEPAPEPPRPEPEEKGQTEIWEKRYFRELRLIGQFKGSYILCESREGLIIIDQHAAHERIYYEALKRSAAAQTARAQMLLVPETVTLSHREADLLTQLMAEFQRCGFEIEPFGGTTFAVKAVPTLLGEGSAAPLIRETVEKIVETGFSSGDPHILMDDAIKVMACHGAIRARRILTEAEMQTLLAQLDRCDTPSHCPHGRPTWIRWSLSALEKAFGRKA